MIDKVDYYLGLSAITLTLSVGLNEMGYESFSTFLYCISDSPEPIESITFVSLCVLSICVLIKLYGLVKKWLSVGKAIENK